MKIPSHVVIDEDGEAERTVCEHKNAPLFLLPLCCARANDWMESYWCAPVYVLESARTQGGRGDDLKATLPADLLLSRLSASFVYCEAHRAYRQDSLCAIKKKISEGNRHQDLREALPLHDSNISATYLFSARHAYIRT